VMVEKTLQWSKIIVTNPTFWIACIWASTKLILKGFFMNCTWNKVVQNPKNKIVNKWLNGILTILILNDYKVY
jgi:hypothetical protein